MMIARPEPSTFSAIQTEKTPSTGPEPARRSVSGGPLTHHGQVVRSGCGGTGTAQTASSSTLAGGSTAAERARAAGYSERTMFRLLRALYRKLPVRNRTEALMYARDHGWI
jgi:hypothetical protein